MAEEDPSEEEASPSKKPRLGSIKEKPGAEEDEAGGGKSESEIPWYEMPKGPEREAARDAAVNSLLDKTWNPFPWRRAFMEEWKVPPPLRVWFRYGCPWAYLGKQKPLDSVWPQDPNEKK